MCGIHSTLAMLVVLKFLLSFKLSDHEFPNTKVRHVMIVTIFSCLWYHGQYHVLVSNKKNGQLVFTKSNFTLRLSNFLLCMPPLDPSAVGHGNVVLLSCQE